MAKIMTIESSKYQDGRQIITGSIGQNENGKSMATADYLSTGGLAHKPEAGEKSLIIPVNGSRYNVAVGCETLIELEQGESAFFSVKNGQIQAAIIAKENGDIELSPLGGQKIKMAAATDSAVLYGPLSQFLSDLVTFINTHTHPGNGAPAATPFAGTLQAESQDVKLS